MAAGKSNAAIGETLFLTESSVEKVIHSIFLKLGLTWEPSIHKRVKAVVLYLGAGERFIPGAEGAATVPPPSDLSVPRPPERLHAIVRSAALRSQIARPRRSRT